jgi:hypothetical protein
MRSIAERGYITPAEAEDAFYENLNRLDKV